ncbi:transposase [Coleofasciculus sp. G1-WW12-02]|uniref:transposase n=1 Tax=unclassified Coleofasciculus TaxID=2692782 RepID=UPI0039F96031
MKLLSSTHAKHCLGYHIVFCPKYRHQVLEGAIEIELKRIIGEVCRTYYGSVGHVSEEAVRKYIETQKQRG